MPWLKGTRLSALAPLPLLALSLGACDGPAPSSTPPPAADPQALSCGSDWDCDVAQRCDEATSRCHRPPPVRNLDVLFVIDNSPSMAPLQRALAQNIPRFIRRIARSGADYHVGVTTTDVGTYTAPDRPWAISLGACNSFAGDDGQLQATPCTERAGVTNEAAAACRQLCPDPRAVPRAGTPYISHVAGVSNVPRRLEADPMTGELVDRGPEDAFRCMALVGDSGCGIEGVLEGGKRALDGHRADGGFLRPGSLLGVVFLTNEDDCSVQLARRGENDPTSRDCGAPDRNASFDCYNAAYRCLARDIVCDQPLNTPGPKTGCRERPGSYLEPVQGYLDFFSRLRPPHRLLVGGIWTLPTLAGGGFTAELRGGMPGSAGLGAAPACGVLDYPWGGPVGFPQHRLSRLAGGLRGSVEVNVCDEDEYPKVLDRIAGTMLRMAGLEE